MQAYVKVPFSFYHFFDTSGLGIFIFLLAVEMQDELLMWFWVIQNILDRFDLPVWKHWFFEI